VQIQGKKKKIKNDIQCKEIYDENFLNKY